MDDDQVVWIGCHWVAGHPVAVLCDAVTWRFVVRSRWTGRDLGSGLSFAQAAEEARTAIAAARRPAWRPRMGVVATEAATRRRPVRDAWRRLLAERPVAASRGRAHPRGQVTGERRR